MAIHTSRVCAEDMELGSFKSRDGWELVSTVKCARLVPISHAALSTDKVKPLWRVL